MTASFQFMAMSFLLNLVWLVILGVATIPVFLYVMLGSICNTEVYGNNFKTVKYCFKLSHYGKLFLEESLLRLKKMFLLNFVFTIYQKHISFLNLYV